MKKPIIIPELEIDKQSFKLGHKHWKTWKIDYQEIGGKVVIKSRQLLEDCELNRTDLIAEEGDLIFKEKKFPFTAQLDFQGFTLYVGGLETSPELSNYLNTKYN